MPNKDVHITAGALSGAALTIYRSEGQSGDDRILETIGGLIGGYCGGRLPDILNPPAWPGHRASAHSITAGGGALVISDKFLHEWEEFCRTRSAHFRDIKENQESEFCYFVYGVLEILFRIAVGLGSGFVAGYISHLLLDSTTPKSLPIV